MGCCKEVVICHILKQFGSNDNGCESSLADTVPVLWDLLCEEAGGNCQLQALLTKREAVLVLIGCNVYSVDIAESHYVMNAESKSDSRNDYHSQAQATGSHNKFAIGTGNTRYDETSTAQSDGRMDRIARAEDKTDGESFYRDDGRGYGFNKSQSYNAIDNSVNHQASSQSNTATIEQGRRRDCNYEYSRNETDGSGFFALIVGASFTGSGSEWRKFSKTRAFNLTGTTGIATSSATENDTGLSTGRGTHRWESNFQADVEWTEREYTIRFSNDRTDSRREASATASGDGDGIYEEKTKSNIASQGTSQQTGRSDTTRTATRTSSTSAFAISNSHRFENLLAIYDQLSEQIQHYKKRQRNNSYPAIATLPCRCGSTCSCEARRMGLYAVQAYRPSKTCAVGTDYLQ